MFGWMKQEWDETVDFAREFASDPFGRMLIRLLSVFLLSVLLIAACTALPAPESDSQFTYKTGSTIPVDYAVYTIAGTIVADVTDRATGQEPGRITGSSMTAGSFSSMSGTYFPGDVQGKGFVRLQVESATPDTELAAPGDITLLKTTDLKAVALLPGDYVTFVCRAQYEAVAAVISGEDFDQGAAGTWELDYCRLKSPVISPK